MLMSPLFGFLVSGAKRELLCAQHRIAKFHPKYLADIADLNGGHSLNASTISRFFNCKIRDEELRFLAQSLIKIRFLP